MAELFVPGTKGWIIVPQLSLAQEIFSIIHLKMTTKAGDLVNPRSGVSVKDKRITTKLRSELYVKSAENPTALQGASLDWVIAEEAGRIDEAAVNMAQLRLIDRGGWFAAISTPFGNNWFERAYRRGQSGDPNWKSWRHPTTANPFIAPAEIEALRQTMPERQFRQDVLAEFLDDEGAVFKNVDSNATGDECDPVDGRAYVIGWDIAKFHDWSAIAVIDRDLKSAVHIERFKDDWPQQLRRVRGLAERYNRAEVIADATGQGDAVVGRLVEMNRETMFSRRIEPVRMHDPKVKRDLIEALALSMERQEISYPKNALLLEELRLYEFERKERTGNIVFHAPKGRHDDLVMALALAHKAVARPRGTSSFLIG